MILTLCAGKGSPGVTTVATALAVAWPGQRVLLEADPAGGDLAFRLSTPTGGLLAAEPSVLALAADAREQLPPGALAHYVQDTSLGVPVVPGGVSEQAFAPMARLWPQVAAQAARWPGTVIADLGHLHGGNPATRVAAASGLVLLVTRADVPEALHHTRAQAGELAARLGHRPDGGSPLAVVVLCPSVQADRCVSAVRQVLAADVTTSTVRVAGYVAHDPQGVQALRAGLLGRRLWGTELLRSAKGLVTTLSGWCPTPDANPDQVPDPVTAGRASRTLSLAARATGEPAGSPRGSTRRWGGVW